MERKFAKKRPTERKPFRKDGDNNAFGGRGGDGARRGQRTPRMSIPKGTEINYKNIAFLQKCLIRNILGKYKWAIEVDHSFELFMLCNE